MTVEKSPFTRASTAIYQDSTKEGLYLVDGKYMVGLNESELSRLLMALNERKEQNSAMSKQLEYIKDDVEYIMEKASKCNDYFKLKSILEALEVITAEI